MNENQEKLIKQLYDSICNDNFDYVADDITEEMLKDENPFIYVKPILKLMENNPTYDFGMPGSLVHFVEKYYKKGYEELLIDSIKRTPTLHTLWMLNRIINGVPLTIKNNYIDIMNQVMLRNDVPDEIKKRAEEYILFQQSKE